MPDYTLQYVYELADFDTSGSLIAPPNEAGARAAGRPPFNLALDPDTLPSQITVTDSDADFEEINGGDQVLTSAVTLNGVTYAAGTKVLVNYVITTDAGFKGYSITLGENNSGNNTTTAFVTTEPMVAGQTYVFTSEGNIGNGAVPYSEFACFTAGTLIKTALGERPVEQIRVGDRVMTRDHGLQIVRWRGERTLPALEDMAPIEFDAGVLGATAPLRVSPNHRMLISGALAEMYFGTDEVLVAAKSLVNGRTIRRVQSGFVTYVHVMFDHHEILWGNGALSESFYIGDQAHKALQSDQQRELIKIFPRLLEMQSKTNLARCEARAHEGRVVAAALL